MRAETFQRDFDVNPGWTAPARASCDALRRFLGRPDLDDALLRAMVRDAVEHVALLRGVDDKSALVNRLLAGEVEDDLVRAVLAALCLPARAAPLDMPTQVLERDSRPARFRLTGLARRLRPARALPQSAH